MEQPSEALHATSRFSLVSQVVQHFETSPIVVLRDTPVLSLPAYFAENRGCRTMAVVDEAGRLVGVIPVSVVIRELLFQVLPEELLPDVLAPGRAAEFTREFRARTAGELMRSPVAITPDAPVGQAVHKLHQQELDGMPVVDAAQRVIGYIDFFQIMLAWWRGEHPSQAG